MKKPLLASLAGFAFATLVRAQEPVFGPEFQVTTSSTTNYQNTPRVASIGAAGNFLVTWTEFQVPRANVVGRLFDVTGAPIGGDIPFTAFDDIDPSAFTAAVQSDAAGNFVVVWNQYSAAMAETNEIRARRYDATGSPLGGEIAVNTYTTGSQLHAAAAMSPSGSFVVVWNSIGQDGSDYGVFGQLFNNSGAPVGSEFQVNQVTTDLQLYPRVAMSPGGDFIVVWSNVYAGIAKVRRYDANGAPLGGEFQVDSTDGYEYGPDVALDATGKAIVVWTGLDGSDGGIFGQRLDASGNKLGPEFNINSFTTGNQERPRVTTGPEGDFTVIWRSGLQDGDAEGLFAQHYDATGRREFRELPINDFTVDSQRHQAIAAQPNGQFVTAWTSYATDNIKARLAGFPDVEPMIVDALHVTSPTAPSVSNFNGVLESGESVLVEPAFRNPSTAPLALTGTASNMRGLPGPTYTLVNTSASYGTIAAGATNGCFDTADCYQVSVSGARPAPHWDALFDETLSYEGFTRTAALHVGGSFPDVPQNAFYPFIENLFHNGVTGGCGGGAYCPTGDVTRAQMAVFLLKSRWGAGFLPPPATGTAFPDVPASHPFGRWIEELVRENITAGCGSGLYCPDNPVTRQQMAVFLLKTLLGSTYDPPPCAGDFDDILCTPNVGFADWVEDLNGRGITAGCQTTPPLYCPAANILRQQMAVFLVKTFGLQLYGS